MTADNLAICFGPNLIRLMDASLATASSLVIAYLIRNYDKIFETVGEVRGRGGRGDGGGGEGEGWGIKGFFFLFLSDFFFYQGTQLPEQESEQKKKKALKGGLTSPRILRKTGE